MVVMEGLGRKTLSTLTLVDVETKLKEHATQSYRVISKRKFKNLKM